MNSLVRCSKSQGIVRLLKECTVGLTRQFSTNDLQRDDRFATLEQSDIDTFKSIVGSKGLITDPDDLAIMNRDWIGKYQGTSKLALKPTTTQQISQILAHCNKRKLAVVPQSGNTGLVGGSVPVFDEVILSTTSMKSIISFDPLSCVAVVESGVVLQSLENYLSDYQPQQPNTSSFTVPLDLGAKGSCCIGGNVATNAGGQRLLRYGSLHGSVLGLEVVLPDGTVIDMLSTLRKDNTGYDLKQLFIGSEGTLGVITKVAILCPPSPTSVNVALLEVGSFKAALEVLKLARQKLAEVLSAFEFLDEISMQLTLRHIPAARLPFSSRGLTNADIGSSSSSSSSSSSFYILIETSGSNASHDAEKLDQFLTLVTDQDLVMDGAVAQDASQLRQFWLLREGVTEALRSRGGLYKYDFSLPTGEMYELVEDTRRRIQEKLKLKQQTQGSPILVAGFGHMGDGNLHLNVSATQYSPQMENILEPWLYEQVAARRGSISAEHGLGLTKADCIHYSKSDSAVEMMKKIKMLFDPVGILNPYKVLL